MRKGGAPKQLYKASLEHPISEDKPRLPGASDEEAGGEASEGGDQAAEEEGRDTKHEPQSTKQQASTTTKQARAPAINSKGKHNCYKQARALALNWECFVASDEEERN